MPARIPAGTLAPIPAGILALQRTAGNRAVSGLLADHGATRAPAPSAGRTVQRLTEAERFENLVAPRYALNPRLQAAFDNQPLIRFAEPDHEAVRLIQQGLVADGFPLPRSTRPNGELDGVYGRETVDAVHAFQVKHTLPDKDGLTGRQVLRRLDELELGGRAGPNSTEEERRQALAIAGLIAVQQRVYGLIRAGLALVPGGTAPDRRDVLLRNSCEWIQRGKARLSVLSPTHDSLLRSTKPGAQTGSGSSVLLAYFDKAAAFPAVGGTYPLAPAPGEETHVAYAPPGFRGTTTNQDIEMLVRPGSSDEEIRTTLIHETQHVADRIEGERPDRPGQPGQPQGPGRVEMFDSSGRRDLLLEGHVNTYQTEFRGRWVEHPEGDPGNRFGSSAAPAANTAAVTFTDNRGAVHTAATEFKNARQEAIFRDLIRSGYPFAEPYTTDARFKRMVDDYELPTGVNLVNSVRVDDLLNALTECNTNMAARHPKITAMLARAADLDEPDRRFLRNTRLARPFWNHAGAHLNREQLARLSALVNR